MHKYKVGKYAKWWLVHLGKIQCAKCKCAKAQCVQSVQSVQNGAGACVICKVQSLQSAQCTKWWVVALDVCILHNALAKCTMHSVHLQTSVFEVWFVHCTKCICIVQMQVCKMVAGAFEAIMDHDRGGHTDANIQMHSWLECRFWWCFLSLIFIFVFVFVFLLVFVFVVHNHGQTRRCTLEWRAE